MEREPLLQHYKPSSVSNNQQSRRPVGGSINRVSGIDLIWILTGLWSAVFLGALDGQCQNRRPRWYDLITD